MGEQSLKDALKDKYSLTSMEVDDVMSYMHSLCREFAVLANRYKTEYFITLKSHNHKVTEIKKEKRFLNRMAKKATNKLDMEPRALLERYQSAFTARELLIAALDAHKISGEHKRTMTDILALMSEHNQLGDEDRTVTGRRAFETLFEAGIGT